MQYDFFHNTNGSEGEELVESQSDAKKQDEVILRFFRRHQGRLFSPPQVLLECGLPNTPLTSIRRAISNLTKSGYLEKTDNRVVGNYGKMNFQWKLKQTT